MVGAKVFRFNGSRENEALAARAGPGIRRRLSNAKHLLFGSIALATVECFLFRWTFDRLRKMMNQARGQELKFAADRMLGRLARWLRVLGADVIYGEHLSGYGLIHAARQEGRLILTRDRRLKQKQPPKFILIESDRYPEQLRQVARECGLSVGSALFTRCLECNAVLQPRSKESVEPLVPPYVFATQEKFSWCPRCRRVYWPATHHQRMVDQLRGIGLR